MNVKNQSKRNCADTALPILHAPLSAPGLTQFCRDIERLFRINPMLNVRHWRCLDANRYFFAGQNISQPMPFDFELILTVRQLSNGLQIEYDQGVKSRTTFTIDPIRALPDSSSSLTITDYYDGLPESERVQQLHRADKSISIWAHDLQRYLFNRHRCRITVSGAGIAGRGNLLSGLCDLSSYADTLIQRIRQCFDDQDSTLRGFPENFSCRHTALLNNRKHIITAVRRRRGVDNLAAGLIFEIRAI